MRKSQTRLPFGPTEKYDEFEISKQNTKRSNCPTTQELYQEFFPINQILVHSRLVS